MNIIQTEKLVFSYEPESEGEPILKSLDIGIESGSFVAVLGHNGSGKSTFAKHLNGILLPTGGKVWIDGMDSMDEEKLLDIRRTVGMVFQNPDNQIVANVVEDDVAFGPENMGVPSEEIRLRVDEALKDVGMYEYRTHAPHLLSGGQKQRVAIARMLTRKTPIMVFDDSLSAVDTETDAAIRDALGQRRQEITTIIISHRISTLMEADRILVLEDGHVAQQGTHEELIAQDGLYRRVWNIQNALIEEESEVTGNE
jgi:energy-coupling factor transport system ATP-binding protein